MTTIGVIHYDRLVETCVTVPADNGIDTRQLGQLLIQLDTAMGDKNNLVYALRTQLCHFISNRAYPVAVGIDNFHAFAAQSDMLQIGHDSSDKAYFMSMNCLNYRRF